MGPCSPPPPRAHTVRVPAKAGGAAAQLRAGRGGRAGDSLAALANPH